MAKDTIPLWLFNNVKRPIFGHMLSDVRPCLWCGFGYETSEADYRNWVTTDFKLRLGFVEVEGWIP
jgi:hypothetical protein